MKFLLKLVSVLLSMGVAAFASCFIAVFAAKFAGGLQTDTWGMGSAYCFLFGGMCGLAVSIICLIVAGIKGVRFVASLGSVLLVPCAFTFVMFSSLSFFGETLPQRRYQEKVKRLSERVRREPSFLGHLIDAARSGSLGKAERSVLESEVLNATRVQSNDVSFLVEYFMDDVFFTQSVLNNKRIINGDLYTRIYDGYKGKSPMVDQIVTGMAKSESTPDEILLDIAEHNSRYAGGVKFPQSIMDQAQETLLMKKAHRDPLSVSNLVTVLRAGSISEVENRVVQKLIIADQFPPLESQYFITNSLDNAMFIRKILGAKTLGPDLIARVYDAFKGETHMNDDLRIAILSRIVQLHQTPDVVLRDIQAHNEQHPNEIRYPEHLLRDAALTLQEKAKKLQSGQVGTRAGDGENAER